MAFIFEICEIACKKSSIQPKPANFIDNFCRLKPQLTNDRNIPVNKTNIYKVFILMARKLFLVKSLYVQIVQKNQSKRS